MGLFASAVKELADSRQSSAFKAYVFQILERKYQKGTIYVPSEDGVKAYGLGELVREIETKLHTAASFLVTQAHTDGFSQVTTVQVHLAIVEAARDLKIDALKPYAILNPGAKVSSIGLARISVAAKKHKAVVRAALLDRQMEGMPTNPGELSRALDDVEDAAGRQVTDDIEGDDPRVLLPVYQEVVWAVADVRLQQFSATLGINT